MDTALESWISELDESFIEEYTNFSNEFDDYVQLVSTPEDYFLEAPPPENQSPPPIHKVDSNTSLISTGSTPPSVEIYRSSFERPSKQFKTDIGSSNTITANQLFNENNESSLDPENGNKNSFAPKAGQKRPNGASRSPVETQDRVMAERKRREKLSERFIALSAMLPGLKKLDKASVLEDAIKYLNQLQENIKFLEEKINKKSSEESVVYVNKSHMYSDDGTSSCDEAPNGHFKEALREIEARISEKYVLIRIHCENEKGFTLKLLSEIEKLHLNVINSSFLPFGQYAVDITVVAEMEAQYTMTVKGLVKNLRSAFMKSI